MKKLIIATALALSSLAVLAADVGVSAVRDTSVDKTGVRVEASIGQLGYVTPKLQITNVQDNYTRYGVVGDVPLGKAGPVNVSGTVGALYQNTDTVAGVDGYGLSVGVKADFALSKDVSVTAGVERFIGQQRVSRFDGNTVSVGLLAKF